MPVQSPRPIEALVAGQATQDGAGVKLSRVLTREWQRRLDPFLMLDHFGSDQPDDYIAGFPDHPHRGFETITYMLAGRMRHRDSAGHEGLITDGGVQWMTAGRGVIHSETPEQSAGLMEGFQLWLNLPGRDKMCEPWYRDIPNAELPRVQGPGVEVTVIAGTYRGQGHHQAGAVQREATQALYLDIRLQPGAHFEAELPPALNAFLYTARGEVMVGETLVPRQRMAVLANTPGSDGVALSAGPQGAHLLLIAGQPLNEPIAQYGPFVMNTQAELRQAVDDFNSGRLGRRA
jgi:redox-sensitive bicupin YhaK (pirin superfamily)